MGFNPLDGSHYSPTKLKEGEVVIIEHFEFQSPIRVSLFPYLMLLRKILQNNSIVSIPQSGLSLAHGVDKVNLFAAGSRMF